MISPPVNDRDCLGQITQVAIELVKNQDPIVVDVAKRYSTTAELAAWIRSLPQRDDLGQPGDGPKADSCDPPQRIDITSEAPNCVERALRYIAVAEVIDPRPERRLATINVPAGRHTLPIENGEPVVLDPKVPRNAARGAVFLLAPVPVRLTPRQAVDWCAGLAEEPAAKVPGGGDLVRNAHEVMARALLGIVIPIDMVDAVGLTLALAEREARAWGTKGVQVVQTTAHALGELDRNARAAQASSEPLRNSVALHVGQYTVRPDVDKLSRLGRVALRLGSLVGGAVARQYLVGVGVTDIMFREMETQLQREGLTLGDLTKPPPIPGSFAALAASHIG